jgi:APA family basic amino acid/polyamine antiporter
VTPPGDGTEAEPGTGTHTGGEPGPGRLARVVGVPGAVLLGLGSILGTGIFVSIGIAAGATGPSVLLAVTLAAALAACNGLSSAQLAAAHPVSGGTYEYGYRYLGPTAGFTAGWMFLAAKSASAATAALGFAGYLLAALGRSGGAARVTVALLLVGGLTAVVAGGMRRSSALNGVVVGVTLMALAVFVAVGAPGLLADGVAPFRPFFTGGSSAAGTGGGEAVGGFLEATALMFVAYTGYGRIATLGEEVREPRRSIPRAIVATLAVSMVLYVAVTAVAVSVAGAGGIARATRAQAAPLEVVARLLPVPQVAWLVGVAALTAMAGVLLNLLLGLSRVLLAMARRGDMPALLAGVSQVRRSPTAAVVGVGVVVALFVTLGSVEMTWSFSAFTVLVYYALTNAAALRLPPGDRRFPRWIAWTGLLACLGLAFQVDPRVWIPGLAVLGAGLLGRAAARARSR